MGPLEWKAYLQERSRQIIEDGDDSRVPALSTEILQSGWLGYEGASKTAIWQAKKGSGCHCLLHCVPSIRPQMVGAQLATSFGTCCL